MKYILIFSLLSFFTLSFASNNELFPIVKGWKISDKVDVYTPDNLWDKINGAADGYYAYAFKKLLVADYTRENEDYISVEIYEHANPVMAFGIYSSERPSDARYNKTGTEGYELEGLFHFLADRFYVKIYTPYRDEAATKAIQKIAKGISEKIGGNQEFPTIIKCFPGENQRPNSTIFVSKNFMGYGFFNSAFVSAYTVSETDFTIFIIEARNADATRDMITSYFKLQKVHFDGLSKGKFIVPDLFNGNIPLMWNDNFIWGIQNGSCINEPFELLKKVELKLKKHHLIQ